MLPAAVGAVKDECVSVRESVCYNTITPMFCSPNSLTALKKP